MYYHENFSQRHSLRNVNINEMNIDVDVLVFRSCDFNHVKSPIYPQMHHKGASTSHFPDSRSPHGFDFRPLAYFVHLCIICAVDQYHYY